MAPKSNFHCDVRTSFAAAFRNWRVKNNIPLKKLSKELGVSISTNST
jgi:hypothetical protein